MSKGNSGSYELYNESNGDSFFLFVLLIMMTIVLLVLARGRLQDRNRNGLLALLLLIPVVNLFIFIPLIFIDGTRGPNKYGMDPKLRERPIPKNWENYNSDLQIEKSNDDSFLKKMSLLDESKSLGIINSEEYEIKKVELGKEKLLKEKLESEEKGKELGEKVRIKKAKAEKLYELHKSGLLSNEEYKAKTEELEND